MIITPYASNLPALLSRLFTSQWFLDPLEHEIQGNPTRFPGRGALVLRFTRQIELEGRR